MKYIRKGDFTMRKIRLRNVSLVLVLALLFSVVSAIAPAKAEAATKTEAPAYSGNYTYYSVYSNIYKLNSKTGKTTKVASVKNAFDVSGISYYNGKLYFTTNYFLGTGGEECYICSMNTNGKGFKKLCRGVNPIVYDKKIYYFKVKHDKEYGSDTTLGVASMSLTGKKQKMIAKVPKDTYIVSGLAAVNGNLYYMDHSYSGNNTNLYMYDIKSSKKTTIDTSNSAYGTDIIFGCDSSYVYYQKANDICAYNVNNNMIYTVAEGDYGYFGGRDGKIYRSDYSSRKLYEYDFTTGSAKLIKSGVYIDRVVYSKSGYNIYENNFSQEEQQKYDYYYTNETVRMKPNGKGYKRLHKYYVS